MAMQHRFTVHARVVLGVLLATCLVSCGQKGPLYLPQQQAKPLPPVETVPAASPAIVPQTQNTNPS